MHSRRRPANAADKPGWKGCNLAAQGYNGFYSVQFMRVTSVWQTGLCADLYASFENQLS